MFTRFLLMWIGVDDGGLKSTFGRLWRLGSGEAPSAPIRTWTRGGVWSRFWGPGPEPMQPYRLVGRNGPLHFLHQAINTLVKRGEQDYLFRGVDALNKMIDEALTTKRPPDEQHSVDPHGPKGK